MMPKEEIEKRFPRQDPANSGANWMQEQWKAKIQAEIEEIDINLYACKEMGYKNTDTQFKYESQKQVLQKLLK